MAIPSDLGIDRILVLCHLLAYLHVLHKLVIVRRRKKAQPGRTLSTFLFRDNREEKQYRVEVNTRMLRNSEKGEYNHTLVFLVMDPCRFASAKSA